MKLIEGKKYKLFGKIFIYDGIWKGYNCDRCNRDRENLYVFVQGKRDSPTQVAKYGSECLKTINIKRYVE